MTHLSSLQVEFRPLRSRRARYGAGVLVMAALLVTPSAAGRTLPSPQHRLTAERAAPDQFTPLDGTVLAAPRPVRGSDHEVHLAYELIVLNPNPVSVVVRRIDTFAPAHPRTVLSSLSGSALSAVMGSITGAPGTRIGPAKTGLVILDLQLDPGAAIPAHLAHRVRASTPGVPSQPFVTGRTRVVDEDAVRVSAPVRGAHWVDLNGCCAASGHRVAVLSVNGALHAAQRFAIDFVQLQADGRLTTGPLDELSSYPYYGTPVRSAAAGVVVEARDGLPNQVPFQPPTGITLATAPGNHVVVALGRDRFAMYAHLRPGSIRVGVGDHVRAGEVLARLGNSGNTDLPHLHFQIMDSASPLGSEGLPFVLPRFSSPGSIPPIDQIDPTRPIPIGAELRGHFRDVLPLDRQVMSFGVG
jgi:hypothetical protein